PASGPGAIAKAASVERSTDRPALPSRRGSRPGGWLAHAGLWSHAVNLFPALASGAARLRAPNDPQLHLFRGASVATLRARMPRFVRTIVLVSPRASRRFDANVSCGIIQATTANVRSRLVTFGSYTFLVGCPLPTSLGTRLRCQPAA